MKRSRWLFPVLVLVSYASPPADALGAEPARTSRAVPDTIYTVPLKGMQDTVTVLPPVRVDAARRAIPERHNESSVRLDRSQLVRFLPQTPVDAISSAPGVEMIRTGPWASRVSFRGLSGERLLVMVDGVRLNTGRGHGTQASLVSVDRLDQVELLPGAGGAEFGSDAMGGVVNLVTQRPLFSDQRSLMLTLSARGSDPGGEIGQSARLRWRSRNWGAEVSGGTSRLDALVTPEGRVPNSGNREEDWSARVSTKLGGGRLDYEHTRHAAHDVGLPAFNSAAGATGEYPLQARDADRFELQAPTVAPMFSVPVQAKLLAVNQLYHSDFDETTVDEIISQRSRQVIAYRTKLASDRITTRSRGLTPEIRFGTDGAVRLSGELRREQTSGPRTSDEYVHTVAGVLTSHTTQMSESVPHARRDVAAASLNASRRFGPLRLESGARYDWMHSRADSTAASFTPRLDVTDRRWSFEGGLAYQVESVESYVRVASGFRAPNLEERYFNGFIHGGLRVFGNADLEAERSMTYETGIRANADGWGSLRLSAYRSEVDDYITFVYVGQLYLIPRFQYRNVHHARIEGVELTGRARLGRVNVSLSASQPSGHDLETGERLNDVGGARVALEVMAPVWRAIPQGMMALRAKWSDAVPSDPLQNAQDGSFTRPAFWNVSAELGMTLAGARATFAVRNLFDLHYREPLSFIDEPGRTFAFALKRDFQLPVFEPRKGKY